MKRLTLDVVDEEYDRLVAIASVLGMGPEEFLTSEGLDMFLSGIENGSIADSIACRIWDTPEEAKAAAVRADAVEESAYWWRLYRTPEDKILLECGETMGRAAEEAGFVLEDCGLSADWKEAA